MAGNLARLGHRGFRLFGLPPTTSSLRWMCSPATVRSEPVTVRITEGSLYVSIFLRSGGTSRMINRVRTDPFEGTLERIGLLSTVATGNSGGDALPVELHDKNGEPKQPGTLNVHAFDNGDVLKIGDVEHVVTVNPPCVLGISFASYLTVGVHVNPVIHSEQCEPDQLCYEWRRVITNDDGTTREEVICTERDYTPTEEDIGCRLSLSVWPIMPEGLPDAPPVTISPLTIVEKDTRQLGYVERAKHTAEAYPVDSDKLRVLSYNILGEMYAVDPTGKNDNYPYCEVKGVQTNYRDMILGRELPAYNADILCLQEVEERRFHQPVLTSLPGYDGRTALKKELREGMSTLWRTDRFTHMESKSFIIKEELFENPICANFFQHLPFRIRNAFKSRNTTLQLIHLQQKSDGRDIIVGNTHLYYHPVASDQRLAMSFVIMKLMADYKQSVAKWTKCPLPPALLLCGDFNGNHERAVHDIITTGRLSQSHPNRISDDNRDVIEHSCEHELKFGSVAPHESVPWSNFTESFVSLLDFVYFEDCAFELEKVVPMPSEETVKEYTALPSVRFCSDHLPVIGDMKFKSM
ncbi:2',5'-phosphodiesterase 12-like [Sycon ciliatum]|uniref:2',5'-phosphodiesterase 12-like n=1 Tax=Sycon ciliatum TaxID=27933 RepID=UPI0031F71335